MASSFPCPNPNCTQVFASQDIRGATSLTCPQCGMVFQFRAAGIAPTPPAFIPDLSLPAPSLPEKKPRPAPPMARPIAPPAGSVASQPVEKVSATPALPAESVPQRAPRRRGRGSRARGRLVVAAVALGVVILAVGICLVVFFSDICELIGSKTGPSAQPSPDQVWKKGNFRFRSPEAPWELMDGKTILGADLVMRRQEPDSWFALVVMDYVSRMPRDDEVLRTARARLSNYFTELDTKLQTADQEEEPRLGDRPARCLLFRGKRNDELLSGECLMMAYQGVAYWFFTWAPASRDQEEVKEEWSKLRQGFALLQEREKWTGKVPKQGWAQGQKAKYTLRYPEDIWRQDPSDDADLFLVGRDPDDPKNARKGATLTVLVRPIQPDLEAAAKEGCGLYEVREREAFKEVEFEPAARAEKSGLPEGSIRLGPVKAHLIRLRVKMGGQRVRFVALAVVPWPEHTLLIICDCSWDHHDAWEDRFWPILQSIALEHKQE